MKTPYLRFATNRQAPPRPNSVTPGSATLGSAALMSTALAIAVGLAPTPALVAAATPASIAQQEYDEVMQLTPDVDNGRRVYLTCAVCHLPEGWGSPDGSYPQIAGQLQPVIVKQLADFRAGNRDNPLMYPFSVPGVLGGPQELADVAAYVAQLPMTPHNGVGPGTDLEHGAAVYAEYCADCHGADGEGHEGKHIPAVAGQHFLYLRRQFHDIRSGARKNADSEMIKQVQEFTPEQEAAVLDYTARLRPPAAKLATDGWTNPDFPHFMRDALGLDQRPPAVPAAGD